VRLGIAGAAFRVQEGERYVSRSSGPLLLAGRRSEVAKRSDVIAAIAFAAACAIFYPAVHGAVPVLTKPAGPSLLLMGGGTDVDAAFTWMSRESGGGDLVVLRAAGDNAYDAYAAGLGHFTSVRTLLLPPCATPSDLAHAASIVSRSRAVFFAGGDQSHYVRWKGTSLVRAVQRVYDDGGVVGGTSAGLAVLGEFAFDAVAADRLHDVHTADAVADPLEPAISFTHDFLRFPVLRGTITDTHFEARDRFGRLAVFMALIARSDPVLPVRGIGVSPRSALAVNAAGWATLLTGPHGGGAFFLRSRQARRLIRGAPFASGTIETTVLDRAGERFDLHAWCGDGKRYAVVVDGERKPIYDPADPYVAPSSATNAACR
jgi:cyanophycinase